MIYFIQNQTNKAIKIGFTAFDPKGRLSQLQTSSPDRLVLLGSTDGDQFAERQLHKRFAEHRLSGEWFKPHQDVVDAVLAFTSPQKPRNIHDVYWGAHWDPLIPMLNQVVSFAAGFSCECAAVDMGGLKELAGMSTAWNPRTSRRGWRFEPHPGDSDPTEFADWFWEDNAQWECFDTPVEAAHFFVKIVRSVKIHL